MPSSMSREGKKRGPKFPWSIRKGGGRGIWSLFLNPQNNHHHQERMKEGRKDGRGIEPHLKD